MEGNADEALEVAAAFGGGAPGAVGAERFDAEVAHERGGRGEGRVALTDVEAHVAQAVLAAVAAGVEAVEVAVEDEARFGEFGFGGETVGERVAEASGPGVGAAFPGAVHAVADEVGALAAGGGESRVAAEAGDGAAVPRNPAVVVHERLLEFGDAAFVDGARAEPVAHGDGGGGADGLAHEGAGGHDARGAHRGMGRAVAASGAEEVVDVSGVERPVGNAEGTRSRVVDCAVAVVVEASREMVVH